MNHSFPLIPARRTVVGQAATLVSPGQFLVQSHPAPQPGPHQVRIRIEGSGLCGSNLPVWEGRPWFDYPLPSGGPGHEGWGRVDQVGGQVENLKPGQRVACLSYRAFADHDVADAANVIALPESLDGKPFPAEPLACALNVFRRCDLHSGQAVAVIGVGFLGALLIQLATHAGARVTAISRREFALQTATRCGAAEVLSLDDPALTDSHQADRFPCVIEATGLPAALDRATHLVGTRGRLVIAGYHQDGPRQIDLQRWNWKGIDVINAHERDPQVYVDGMRAAIDAVTEGRLTLDGLITHTFGLSEINDAFVMANQRPDGFLKAIVASA